MSLGNLRTIPTPGARDARKPTKRRPGRPARDERPIGPDEIERIADLWLCGRSLRRIAEEFGVDPKTISHHLEKHIRPVWRSRMGDRLCEEIAKIDHVERIAWQKFHESESPQTRDRVKSALSEGGADLEVVEQVFTSVKRTGEPVWLNIVQWCIDARARFLDYEAPRTIKVQNEYRVAGKSPDKVNEEMMRRLLERIAERKVYEQSLREQGH